MVVNSTGISGTLVAKVQGRTGIKLQQPGTNEPLMRAAFLLISSAFALACLCLWGLLDSILPMLLRSHIPPHGSISAFTQLCFRFRSALLVIALVAVGYAVIKVVRNKATVENFCIFAAILSAAFTLVFAIVLIGAFVCWIPIQN
jgi:hypothetical protein